MRSYGVAFMLGSLGVGFFPYISHISILIYIYTGEDCSILGFFHVSFFSEKSPKMDPTTERWFIAKNSTDKFTEECVGSLYCFGEIGFDQQRGVVPRWNWCTPMSTRTHVFPVVETFGVCFFWDRKWKYRIYRIDNLIIYFFTEHEMVI